MRAIPINLTLPGLEAGQVTTPSAPCLGACPFLFHACYPHMLVFTEHLLRVLGTEPSTLHSVGLGSEMQATEMNSG